MLDQNIRIIIKNNKIKFYYIYIIYNIIFNEIEQTPKYKKHPLKKIYF